MKRNIAHTDPDLSREYSDDVSAKESDIVTESVVEAMSRHDHEAFRKVYLHSIGPLVRFLRVLLHSRDDAEDMAQSVFAHIWENVEKIDPSKNFNGYLYVIARNMALKQMARKKLYEKYCDFTISSEPDFDPAVDEIVMNREMALLVNIYIDNLPAQRKRVFEMHCAESKSDGEIAQALNVSINTVRTHLRLAKKGLRELAALSSMLVFTLMNTTSSSLS